jgi:hypothetical protein
MHDEDHQIDTKWQISRAPKRMMPGTTEMLNALRHFQQDFVEGVAIT